MTGLTSGLIITPALMQRQVSVDLHFQPSVGILARKVDKLGVDIRSFREPLKDAVQKVMIPSIRRNFDAEGRPAWEPLAQSTVIRRGESGPILNRSGALRRTMGYLKIWHIDTEKAMITDLPQNVWYGKVHQAGHGAVDKFFDPVLGKEVDLGDGATPARPFVMVQDEDEDAITQVFDMWLAKRIRMAGL